MHSAIKALCQRVLDEQGFLVLAMYREYEIGHVLRGFIVDKGGKLLKVPVVVIGVATKEEWLHQRKRYSSGPDSTSWTRFYKVTCE